MTPRVAGAVTRMTAAAAAGWFAAEVWRVLAAAAARHVAA